MCYHTLEGEFVAYRVPQDCSKIGRGEAYLVGNHNGYIYQIAFHDIPSGSRKRQPQPIVVNASNPRKFGIRLNIMNGISCPRRYEHWLRSTPELDADPRHLKSA
ncbi:MAG: hypothetical protein WA941_19735 [Nitrososphaeraceae archaeon]